MPGLVEHVARDVKELPFVQAVAELNTRFTRAREARTELKGLEKQRRQEEKTELDRTIGEEGNELKKWMEPTQQERSCLHP